MCTASSFRRLVLATIWMLGGIHEAGAQYSRGAQSLRKTSELYDERGFAQSKALTVDGKLAVAAANGSVSYSYPLAQRTMHGFPITVSLNYCNAVSFSTYTSYDNGSMYEPYSRWARFHQNRPAWLLGVNGFAVQALSFASSYHCDPAKAALTTSGLRTSYNDSDFVWIIDGYDACNRMEHLATSSTENPQLYVDVIRILRDDGSILELVNAQEHNTTVMHNRSDLYTGYYRVNEANARGHGIVEFDSTLWTDHARAYTYRLDRYNYPMYPFIPRKLRYFSGDGLEYVFREWIAAFGLQSYGDPTSRYGGMHAAPSIFYLEEIRANDVVLTRTRRSRHNPMNSVDAGPVHHDSTRGRALFTELESVCQVLYGRRSMAVQAGGRTVQVVFDTLATSGSATSNEHIPLAQLGYVNAWSRAFGAAPEDRIPYKSMVAYVTKIIDPEGRQTRFRYERYRRRFRGFGFPVAGSEVEVAMRNWRLTEVDEPAAHYALCYYTGDARNPLAGADCDSDSSDELMTFNTMSADNPSALTNMVREVIKSGHDGLRLITDSYSFDHFDNTSSAFRTAVHRSLDHPAATTRTLTYAYARSMLPALQPFAPAPAFTELRSLTDDIDGMRTVTATTYDAPAPGPYLWLPSSTTVTVNGVLKSHATMQYVADTVRRYGDDHDLTAACGWEVTRRVTRTFNPDSSLRLVDTVDYAHFALRDTTLTRIERRWDKLASIQRYLALRNDATSGIRGRRWEQVMYDARVAVYRLDTQTRLVSRSPHYGVVSRSIIADADGGVLGGTSTTYRGMLHPASTDGSPAVVVSESAIGRGGVIATRAISAYGRAWTSNLAVARTDANGARTLDAFDSVRDGSSTVVALARSGQRRTGDDSTRADALVGLSPELLESPIAQLRLVRRGLPGGSIRIDTIATELERSYFSQISATADANGWITRSRYDRNGRLVATWLPGDYPRASAPDTFYVEGSDSIDLYGVTSFTRRIDTLQCHIAPGRPPTYPRDTVAGASPIMSIDELQLYAARPTLLRARCPCGDTAASAKYPSGAGLMRDCGDTLTYEALGSYPGYRGHLFYTVDSASVLHTIERMDSALLRLYVSNIEGECVSVRVSIPAFAFTRSYLFNCNVPGSSTLRANREHGGALASWAAVRTVRSLAGPYFDVRLDSIRDQLLALRTNDTFGIEISVTSPGTGIRFASGSDAADVRPKLMFFGRYRTISDTVDYTLAYRHVDDSLMTEVMAKTDDIAHTANRWQVNRYHSDIRRSRIRHHFGADFVHRFSQITIGEPQSPRRLDTIAFAYTGAGTRSSERDQLGRTTSRTFDGRGRVIATEYPDSSTATIEYVAGTPQSCGIVDEGQFDGYCEAVIATNENGERRAAYSDAFGNLRRQVTALGSLNLTTRLDYDLTGRITRAIDPEGDTTLYWYDALGRVRYKRQPDLGTVSYAYDSAGHVRFTQSSEQAAGGLVTYAQFDDLGRTTIVGEASIETGPFGNEANRDRSKGQTSPSLMRGGHENPAISLNRLTDALDGSRIYTGITADTVSTVNGSIWLTPAPGPVTWAYAQQTLVPGGCQLRPTALLAEAHDPPQPYISHPISYHNPVTAPIATLADFENVARYPHFVRTAVYYDEPPARQGAIWGAAPTLLEWQAIAPGGALRNLKGREAAVAWREHGGEPFNYAAISYDARGRIEALLRYTDNVGFDAVYYTYNSLNQVTSVRVADPLNQHTSWYGYDENGKLDTMWTLLQPGGGLGLGAARVPSMPKRPELPDVVYAYARTGHVATMEYPGAAVAVEYEYTARKWIDSIVARSTGAAGSILFKQVLAYDAAGQMVSQRVMKSDGIERLTSYGYDRAQRLTQWREGVNTDALMLDGVGNRIAATSDRTWLRTAYTYAPASAGPNRLLSTQSWNSRAEWQRTDYTYDRDGAVSGRQRSDSTFVGIRTAAPETFTYSYRELLRRYTFNGQTHDWRYRYNPSGEREQKRLYPVDLQHAAASNENPWAYYLLGAANEQLAVWHGREIYLTQCAGASVGTVWMYPVIYNCLGGGLTRVATRPDPAAPSGVKEYYVADGLGSTRLVVGAGGAVVEEPEYDPHGQPTGARVAARQTYIGRERDPESGLGDFGVRKYEPAEGRFHSIDPRWEEFRNVSPYLYAHANPLNRVDANGQWDIVVHVSKDRSQNGYGVAVVTNRKGEEVFRFSVLVQGRGSDGNPRDRMKRFGDTPLGVYDIPDGSSKWRSDGSRAAYGPQARLVLEGQAGEIVESNRSAIRVHGGRQEGKANPTLEPTHGCIRAYDATVQQLKDVVDGLEAEDPEEKGGTLTVIDDLTIVDGEPTFPNDPVTQQGAR